MNKLTLTSISINNLNANLKKTKQIYQFRIGTTNCRCRNSKKAPSKIQKLSKLYHYMHLKNNKRGRNEEEAHLAKLKTHISLKPFLRTRSRWNEPPGNQYTTDHLIDRHKRIWILTQNRIKLHNVILRMRITLILAHYLLSSSTNVKLNYQLNFPKFANKEISSHLANLVIGN